MNSRKKFTTSQGKPKLGDVKLRTVSMENVK
jgi:hypothetical protein